MKRRTPDGNEPPDDAAAFTVTPGGRRVVVYSNPGGTVSGMSFWNDVYHYGVSLQGKFEPSAPVVLQRRWPWPMPSRNLASRCTEVALGVFVQPGEPGVEPGVRERASSSSEDAVVPLDRPNSVVHAEVEPRPEVHVERSPEPPRQSVNDPAGHILTVRRAPAPKCRSGNAPRSRRSRRTLRTNEATDPPFSLDQAAPVRHQRATAADAVHP